MRRGENLDLQLHLEPKPHSPLPHTHVEPKQDIIGTATPEPFQKPKVLCPGRSSVDAMTKFQGLPIKTQPTSAYLFPQSLKNPLAWSSKQDGSEASQHL